jgi:hypothetical protein
MTAQKTLLTLDQLRRSGLEQSLNREVVDFKLKKLQAQHYSMTFIADLIFKGGYSKEIFCKKHRGTDLQELVKYNMREAAILDVVHSINQTLVPRLFGRISDLSVGELYLFSEKLIAPSDSTKYIRLEKKFMHKKDQNYAEQKLQCLRDDFRAIAKFNGNCQVNRNKFPAYLVKLLREVHKRRELEMPDKLAHYLRRAVHFKFLRGKQHIFTGGTSGWAFDERRADRFVKNRKKVNLVERLQKVLYLRSQIDTKTKLQHGDCRPHHNYNGTWCDVEDFGFYKQEHDIVTYSNEEICRPYVGDLPSLIAYYMAVERAYSSKSREFTMAELNNLEETNPHSIKEMIRGRIPVQKHANAIASYLAGSIKNDIHIHGVRKKYSLKELDKLVGGYPGYGPKTLHNSRMKHIEEIFDFATSPQAGILFGNCSNRNETIGFFYETGKLLEDLGLIKVNGLGHLEKLSKKISQWDFYFPDK